jgi:hypothetical protein
MHVLMLSLIIALLACVLLLAVFGLFTISPFARKLEGSKGGQSRDRLRLR